MYYQSWAFIRGQSWAFIRGQSWAFIRGIYIIELQLIEHDKILKSQSYKQWQISTVDSALNFSTSDCEFDSHWG